MKRKLFRQLYIISLFAFVKSQLQAATGEVSKSGSTWMTKVDGSTKLKLILLCFS